MDPNIVNNPTWQVRRCKGRADGDSVAFDRDAAWTTCSIRRTGIYVNPRGDGDSWEVTHQLRADQSRMARQDSRSTPACGFAAASAAARAIPSTPSGCFFRQEYGDGELNYPLFGSEGVDEFDKVDLRTAQNYSWAFQSDGSNDDGRGGLEPRHIRATWVRPTRAAAGITCTSTVNIGGCIRLRSVPSRFGATSYFGGERGGLRRDQGRAGLATTSRPPTATWLPGRSYTTWPTRCARPRHANGSRMRIYMQLQGKNPDGTRNLAYPVLLDVDNLIEYMQVIFYSGDRDAPISNFLGNTSPNNWFGIRNRNGDDGFRFIVHDRRAHAQPRPGQPHRPIRRRATDGNGLEEQPAVDSPDADVFRRVSRAVWRSGAAKLLRRWSLHTRQGAGAVQRPHRAKSITAIIAESARWGDAKTRAAVHEDQLAQRDATTRATSLSRGKRPSFHQLRSNTLFNGGRHVGPLYPTVECSACSISYGGQVAPGFNFLDARRGDDLLHDRRFRPAAGGRRH